MALKTLSYLRSWINDTDFPTYVTEESRVREDLQYHPDVIKNYINNDIVAGLAAQDGASHVGYGATTVAGQLGHIDTELASMADDINRLAAGDTPQAVMALRLGFPAENWTAAENGYELRIPPEIHKRTGPGFLCEIRMWNGEAYVSNTWATAGTIVRYDEATDYIVLSYDCAYYGEIVFLGVQGVE